jgi:hypothetical protein
MDRRAATPYPLTRNFVSNGGASVSKISVPYFLMGLLAGCAILALAAKYGLF